VSREKLRTAVVGANVIGAHHLRHAAKLPEFQVVATCDLNQQIAQELASEFEGATAYNEYSIMLREARPDVVIVATTTAAHAPLPCKLWKPECAPYIAKNQWRLTWKKRVLWWKRAVRKVSLY
jgi:ornithine cyclodeaminase/alanine dehydrogenase-like protein (mu-crystallin family)